MSKKIIAPYMKAGLQAKVLYLGFGSIIYKIENQDLQKMYLTCLDTWRFPYTFEEMKFFLLQNGYAENLIDNILEEIVSRNYVIDADIFSYKERYSRNLLHFALSGGKPKVVQEQLQKSHVVILGCGGIGNMISVCLATSGVGHLTLIDDDIVETSNLTRQFLFTNRDIGQKKVYTLKKALLERSSDDIHIEAFDARASEELMQQISPVTLIVLSADSEDCLPLITHYCLKNEVPLVPVGYIQDIAAWGPFVIPGKTGCPYCQNVVAKDIHPDQMFQDRLNRINQQYQAPSTGAINMLASALSILDIMRFLGGFGAQIHSHNRRIGLWTHTMKLEEQNCIRNHFCSFCSHIM